VNELPKLVFSNTLSEAPWGAWPPARVVHGDAVTEIERMKAQEGKHMVLWGSLSLAPKPHRGGPDRRVSRPALPDAGWRRANVVPQSSRLLEAQTRERADLRDGRCVPPLRTATLRLAPRHQPCG